MDFDNPETVVSESRAVYRGIIVNLKVDTVRLESGREVIREVVHHPGGVVAVPMLPDGRLLLVRQFRYPLQKFILEFPAGKLDSELSPLETIKRELAEEGGYSAGTITHEFSFYTTPGISDEIIHVFLARDLTPVPQNLEEGEHITVEPYTLEECLEKIKAGEIQDGKTILGALWLQFKNAVK
jgi:ADP-ribose pyrophosphatase